jgi:hypothetical protein
MSCLGKRNAMTDKSTPPDVAAQVRAAQARALRGEVVRRPRRPRHNRRGDHRRDRCRHRAEITALSTMLDRQIPTDQRCRPHQ